jgi:hypothetical protein
MPVSPLLKRRLLVAAALLATAGGISALAAAEQALIWSERSNGGLTTLAYGPIDRAANPLFLLSCFNGMNIAVLDVHQEISGTEPGKPVTIELSSAKAETPVKGEVERNDATGTTFAEASDIPIQPVLEVLRDPGTLTLKMGEASATLSEQGRAEAVAAFSRECELD